MLFFIKNIQSNMGKILLVAPSGAGATKIKRRHNMKKFLLFSILTGSFLGLWVIFAKEGYL